MSAQESVDASVKKWDEILSYFEAGGDRTYGYLQLAESDLDTVDHTVVCPYCRKLLISEVKLIRITIRFSRIANEWEASRGLRKRLSLIGRSLPLIASLTYLELTKML
jgi:hypothetical protein